MPTFIKAGYWEKLKKAPKEWLNLDLLIQSIATGGVWGSITGTLSNQTDLQDALDTKAEESDLTAHVSNTSNPHSVTKTQIGLSNVDNTSDVNKPVSTATQAALDLKSNEIISISAKTDDYPLVLADFDTLPKLFTFSKATALSITVPTNASQAIVIGRSILVQRTGVGVLTFTPADGTVTITGSSGALTDAGLNVIMLLTKTGTNTWDLQNGAPGTWTAWIPSWTGFSANPTSVTARYSLIGKTCHVSIRVTAGTSNASTTTVTLPFAAANTAIQYAWGLGVDNGTNIIFLSATRVNSNVLDCYSSLPALTWSSSGLKAININFTYEIA